MALGACIAASIGLGPDTQGGEIEAVHRVQQRAAHARREEVRRRAAGKRHGGQNVCREVAIELCIGVQAGVTAQRAASAIASSMPGSRTAAGTPAPGYAGPSSTSTKSEGSA